jgi:hypothetical protein
MERKFLFMRCIFIWMCKVAGDWICLQNIIKCGDNECNECGYLSKPLHVYWAFKGLSRRKLCTVSTKTRFKCRTIKVKHTVYAVKYKLRKWCVYGISLIYTAFDIYKLLELKFRKFWIEKFAQSQISQIFYMLNCHNRKLYTVRVPTGFLYETWHWEI